MSWQVREHCLERLIGALQENSAKTGAGDPVEAAVALEYGVFLSVKSVQVYKLTIHKKVHVLIL